MKNENQLMGAVNNRFSPNLRYQKILVVLMCLIWIQMYYLQMITSFIFMNPLFECDGEKATQFTACLQLEKCKITNNYTGTFHAKLYCDRQSQRETIQSAFTFGVIFGTFLIPILSDWKGRRLIFLSSIFMTFFGALFVTIGIYMLSVFLMILGQILIGASIGGIIVLTYIITAQFCEDKTRQFAIIFYNGMWGFSEASFIVIYYFLPEWYNYMMLLVLIPLAGIVVICYFFIIQSPFYCLLMKKNLPAYESSLKKIAIFNQPTQQNFDASYKLGQRILKNYQKQHNSQKKSIKQIMLRLFKTKKYLKALILLVMLYSGFNFAYYGSQMCVERTGFNYGITMLFIGVAEFLTNLLCGYFISSIPRKIGLVVTLVFGAILGLLFIYPPIRSDQITQTILVIFYRVAAVAYFTFFAMLQTQIFDPTVKSTAIGLLSSMGKVVNLVIPFLVGTMNDRGIHPIVATSILFVCFSTLPIYFVQQTYHIIEPIIANNNKQTQQNEINSDLINKQQQILQNQQYLSTSVSN